MEDVLTDWNSGEAWSCKVKARDALLEYRATNSSLTLSGFSQRNDPSAAQTPRSSSLNSQDTVAQDGMVPCPESADSAVGGCSCIAPKDTTGTGRVIPSPAGMMGAHEVEGYRPIIDIEINHSWPKGLPPKQLYGYRHETAFFRLLRTLSILALIGATLYSTVKLVSFENIRVEYNSCESSSASWFESRFFINVVVMQGLSFTEAKLIDLAWDTFIGQGLRFMHAWWLYQVSTHLFTYLLETSSLPYEIQLNILFSPASFSSLWATLGLAFKRQRSKGRLYFVWLIYAISYILLFPTLWAASTGYASPSITAYNMSHKAYVPIESEDMTLCWSFNDTRLIGLLDDVVLGTSFNAMFGSALDKVPNGKVEWKQSNMLSDFSDLFYYAKTKHSLQNYFNASNSSWSRVDLNHTFTDDLASWLIPDITINRRWDGLSFANKSNPTQNWPSPGLSRELEGFQFLGTDNYTNAIYYRNDSVVLSLGIVPYNSTLKYRDSNVLLPAPFIDFGINCSWWNSSTGECPCYMGEPLAADWAIEDQFSCISAQGYIWGFSSFILLISLILETSWVVGCWYIRLHTTLHSNLINFNRRSIGTARHVLDLAEAMNRDLGPNTSIYTDRELRDALHQCPPIGYELECKGGIKHLGLVTVHHGDEWRGKIDLNFDDTYG
ncbi:hypothetical protein F5Y13DRAFT_200114 [Hypoxylon sp. FL1857]|nr:hypothetical protein F5Y13DRAFT_200114 [Hypoxylon sp. FL1857]